MTARKTFLALFDGWCPICHKRIEEGDEAAYDDDKNVVHASCAEDDE